MNQTKPETKLMWVNISQLAELLETTRETVRARLAEHPDIPKRTGRKNGTEYPAPIALPIVIRRERAALAAALRILGDYVK